MVRQEDLYERLRRTKTPEFEGSTDPLVANEWLAFIQTIFGFMNITDQEKVTYASYILKKDVRYWW